MPDGGLALTKNMLMVGPAGAEKRPLFPSVLRYAAFIDDHEVVRVQLVN
jgi:hypothetical protein